MNETVPTTMQAVQQDKPGGPLVARQVPVPGPKAGQVLVRMAAAPINPTDLGALLGMAYRGERTYPFIPGSEGSGTVVGAGKGLRAAYLKGRRVACTTRQPGDGTWAEYMVTSAKLCIPIRTGLSLEAGAMLIVNPLTALAIFDLARRENHQAIVNTAAAGVLGGMIQRLGVRHNIPIINTVRRPEQVEQIQERGAQYVLNSKESDFVEQLGELVQRYKATLLLDAVGGNMTQQLVDAALYGSTIFAYSRLSRKDSPFNATTLLVKNLKIVGWYLPNWMREKNLVQALQLTRKAQSLVNSELHSPVRQRIPLSAAQDGLDTYLSNMSAGKVLFIMDKQTGSP